MRSRLRNRKSNESNYLCIAIKSAVPRTAMIFFFTYIRLRAHTRSATADEEVVEL